MRYVNRLSLSLFRAPILLPISAHLVNQTPPIHASIDTTSRPPPPLVGYTQRSLSTSRATCSSMSVRDLSIFVIAGARPCAILSWFNGGIWSSSSAVRESPSASLSELSANQSSPLAWPLILRSAWYIRLCMRGYDGDVIYMRAFL